MSWTSVEAFHCPFLYPEYILDVCVTMPNPDGVRVELLLDAACDLGESPAWDLATGTLYFTVSASLQASSRKLAE